MTKLISFDFSKETVQPRVPKLQGMLEGVDNMLDTYFSHEARVKMSKETIRGAIKLHRTLFRGRTIPWH